MKKILGFVSVLLLLGSTVFGANLTTNTANSLNNKCDGGVFNWTYYANKTPTQYLFDVLQGTKDKHYIIGFKSSYATIYNPYSAIQFENGGAFAYKSEIKPRGVSEVIVVHQNNGGGTKIVGHANKRSDIAAQVVFNIARKIENGTLSQATGYQYMNIDKTIGKVSTDAAFNSSVTTDNECLNIYVGWCGDGVLDNGSNLKIEGQSTQNGQLAGGEICDEGALNGTPGHCNTSCTGTGTNPVGGLILNKSLVTTKTYLSGETVEFRISFGNNGQTDANNVILQDVLPNSLEYVSSEIYGVSATFGQKTENGNIVIEYSGFALKSGQSGYMIIRAKVKVPQCLQNNINRSFLYANNDTKPLVAQASYTCTTDHEPGTDPICQSVTAGVLNSDNTSREVVCMGKNTTATTPMIIDCGDGASSQYLQGYPNTAGVFSSTCKYTSSSKAKSAKIACKVANSTCNTTIGACKIDANVHVAVVEDEGNGKVKYTCETKNGEEASLQIFCGNEDKNHSDIEVDNKLTYTCKYTEEDYKNAGSDRTLQAKCVVDGDASCSVDTVIDKGILSYCGNGVREGYEECDGGGNNGEGEWKGQMCKEGCTLCDECHDEVTQCLSIDNGNVSVQKDEMLPFWWRMYKPAYIVEEDKCEDKSQAGNVLRDSMKCTFSLRQPGEDKPVDILEDVDCDRQEITNQALFSNFYKDYRSKAFGTWYVDLDKILDSKKFEDNVFGEYKLRLHKLDYDYCNCDDDGDCDWKKTQINNICETNFTITRPYLIQKNAFGSSPKATDAKLTNFFDIIGNPLIKKTDLEDVMILDEDAYDGGNDAKFLILSEASKIAKLAVKMQTNALPEALRNTNISVKKVPNKAIYLLESSSKSTYTINPAKFTTAFTIITKNINLVIDGSLDVNGMFITQNGTITFAQNLDQCGAPQVVRGIFVAGNGFSTNKIENNTLTKKWCQYGNLQVKGILVGAGIDNLVQNRRSNLNNWFNVNGSEKSIKVQRRNQIFNGASLMIEYNPDLWKTLPPGAEQFVNLLDVYKK